MANTNATVSPVSPVSRFAAAAARLATMLRCSASNVRDNALVSVPEALAAYGLTSDAKLTSKLNRDHGYVEFDVVVTPAMTKKVRGKKVSVPAVTKTITLDAKILAAAITKPEGARKEHGLVFAKVEWTSIKKSDLALLISNKCLMPPTRDGANVCIAC